jgi:hypothetical protein
MNIQQIISTVIIGAAVLGYVGFVIYRQIKRIREGKCNCGCENCPSKIKECKNLKQE